MKNEDLRPTLWRTARALANKNRLLFFRAVWLSKGEKGVSELARDVGLSISTASVYLRALNARGLISVRRVTSHVYYGNGTDRSLPEAQLLQTAFAKVFSRKKLPDNWPEGLIPTLRAYSHLRRITILQCLAEKQRGFTDLSFVTGIPEMSLARHLRVLSRAQIVSCEKNLYSIVKPRNVLQSAFLEIALSGDEKRCPELSHFMKCDSSCMSETRMENEIRV